MNIRGVQSIMKLSALILDIIQIFIFFIVIFISKHELVLSRAWDQKIGFDKNTAKVCMIIYLMLVKG